MEENKMNINWYRGIYKNTIQNVDISTLIKK